ncbi:bacteriohemerythrin [Azospirillum halopraeferens]|uniref:bacteriohemerythrin n=1 Tax=Azospirillum halopraeferens TaxID=34010 RepID=UPI0003F95445|nr:hemerythrin family protein [Azospirillum halopraeferens]
MGVAAAGPQPADPFATGDAVVDAAHMRLCALYAVVRESLEAPAADGPPPADLRTLCRELLGLAGDHFAAEEALMAATGFPERDVHRRLHAAFLERLEGIRSFILAGAGADETGDYVRRYLLLAAIGQWLKVHTAIADRRFVDFLAATGQGPAAADCAG